VLWKSFYEQTVAPLNKAIRAKDWNAFDTAYNGAISDCNGCHIGAGYKFIEVTKLSAPPDGGMDYELKSEPGDVPK
jgi:hypothetical protein